MKRCTICKELKDESEFYQANKTVKKINSACKICVKQRNRNKKDYLLIPNLKGEIWVDIQGFEGLYKISNKQRIKSLDRLLISNRGREIRVNERILKYGKHVFGYSHCTLRKDFKNHYLSLHRLLAIAFIPNPDNLPCINHIDCNPSNNAIENLEWVTFSQNSRYAYKTGRLSKLGEKNHMAKLNSRKVLSIFNSKKGSLVLSKKYNVSQATVNDIKAGKRWCHITGKKHPSVKKRICEQ